MTSEKPPEQSRCRPICDRPTGSRPQGRPVVVELSLEFDRRPSIVRIKKGDPVRARARESGSSHAETISRVRVRDGHDGTVIQRVEPRKAAVDRAVVNDEHVPVRHGLRAPRLDHLAEEREPVVGSQDDRSTGRHADAGSGGWNSTTTRRREFYAPVDRGGDS